MAKEIERKFLVDISKWEKRGTAFNVIQGYLLVHPKRVVRVRIIDQKAYLTIKGNLDGIVRDEFEYEIPEADARELLKMCEDFLVEKTRYILYYFGKKWEIDCFHGENEGLVVAEVELNAPDEEIELPAWVTSEVSEETKYYNFYLSRHPYSQWQ
ncbi:MAG: CYTH domain-containing protein [Prolixibacteraceae bacterium]|nr:CYTH domain-containing protein [Prolixibacteraceae bacterium]